MSILDLAFRFNSPLSGGNGSVPAGTNLGQQASSDRSLNLLGKRPARRAWDTWDTPYTVPVGTAACGGSLGTPGTVGTPGTAPRPYPNEWSEAIDRLLSRPCPDAVSAKDWTCACRGVEQVARGWAAKAMALGWTFEELFALRDPFANGSLQGAGWFVGDKTVTAVTADAITLRSASGSTTRIYRAVGVSSPAALDRKESA
jgi:hypothetical protein